MGTPWRFAAGTKPLPLLLVLLTTMVVFGHLLVCSKAVPCTRIRRLDDNQQLVLPPVIPTAPQVSTAEVDTESLWEEEQLDGDDDDDVTGWSTTSRRMGLQLNDYPGSGANNRHIPKPPARK